MVTSQEHLRVGLLRVNANEVAAIIVVGVRDRIGAGNNSSREGGSRLAHRALIFRRAEQDLRGAQLVRSAQEYHRDAFASSRVSPGCCITNYLRSEEHTSEL